MVKVEAPFVGTNVSTSKGPISNVKGVALGVGGIALYVMMSNLAQPVGNWASQQVGGFLGMSSQQSGDGILGDL